MPGHSTLASGASRNRWLVSCEKNQNAKTLHYDLASLFAGKFHAVLFRPYSKGRDWHDLLWYLTSAPRIEPNFEMLDNALAQSGWTGPKPTPGNWKELLKSAAEAMDEKPAWHLELPGSSDPLLASLTVILLYFLGLRASSLRSRSSADCAAAGLTAVLTLVPSHVFKGRDWSHDLHRWSFDGPSLPALIELHNLGKARHARLVPGSGLGTWLPLLGLSARRFAQLLPTRLPV
jgi:hypothetical protein